jgi:hypothetical protein
MVIEIVDFPMKNGGSFHSYVKLPEGTILEHVGTSTLLHFTISDNILEPRITSYNCV